MDAEVTLEHPASHADRNAGNKLADFIQQTERQRQTSPALHPFDSGNRILGNREARVRLTH